MFGKGKSLLGLDIGSSSVKVLELKESKTGYQLVTFGMEPLPHETIVDSTIMNAPAVVSAIRKLISTYQIKTKDVCTSVSGHSVIIRKITLPLMTEEEIAGNIQWEAEQYIPFDINEVNIDYQRLITHTEDAESQDVLLVAVKKDVVNDYVSVVNGAGLNPMIIDVDAFTIQNMLEINYDLQPGKVVAMVNIGAGIININIVFNGNSIFTRDISIGGNHFTEEIQKFYGISYDEAEQIKLGQAGDAKLKEVREVMNGISSSIALEVQRSLDFFMATSSVGQITDIYLSGGCAKTPGLSEIIGKQTSIPVEIVDPFKKIQINPKNFDMEYIKEIAPLAGVAVGLALRRVGDK